MCKIDFTMEWESFCGFSDHPWRKASELIKKGTEMSQEGRRRLDKFNQQIQQIVDARKLKTWTASEWEEFMKIYRKLWPFKGSKPEALDWRSLSATELVQAVS